MRHPCARTTTFFLAKTKQKKAVQLKLKIRAGHYREAMPVKRGPKRRLTKK